MVRKYLFTLVDQGLVSAFNFLLNILLIRAWEPDYFGVFVFWSAIAQTCIGFQNALINTPLNVFGPGTQDDTERFQIETALSSANYLYIFVAFSAILIVFALLDTEGSPSFYLSLVIAAFIAGRLFREYARSAAFSRHNVKNVLLIDGCYFAFGALVFVTYSVDAELVDLLSVFAVLAAGSFVGGVTGLFHGPSQNRALALNTASVRAYIPIWRHTRWSLVSVGMHQIQNRSYIYLVTAFAGLEALGILAAARILVRPVGVLLAAWGRTARPHLARTIAKSNINKFVTLFKYSCLFLFIAFAVYSGLIYFGWPYVEDLIYQEKYGDVGWLVVGWVLVSVVGGYGSIVGTHLQALKQFKALATALTFGSVVSVVLVAWLLVQLGYQYVSIGMLLGSLVVLAMNSRKLWRSIGEMKKARREAEGV